MPGIHYLFGVDESARLAHQLAAHCETVGHTVHGLTGLAVQSLQEDRYGVVQADLGRIVRAVLQLRTELDRIVVVALPTDARQRCSGLRGTVSRSLCRLATAFGKYLPDVLDDQHDIRTMESFAQFRET